MDNTASYALARLRKNRPDIHARVLAGELSPHAGMIEAGFRRRARKAFLSELGTQTDLHPGERTRRGAFRKTASGLRARDDMPVKIVAVRIRQQMRGKNDMRAILHPKTPTWLRDVLEEAFPEAKNTSREEATVRYQEHLRSPRWQDIRERKLRAAGHRCEFTVCDGDDDYLLADGRCPITTQS